MADGRFIIRGGFAGFARVQTVGGFGGRRFQICFQRREQNLTNQRGLARAADAGEADEAGERDVDGQVAKVVAGGVADREPGEARSPRSEVRMAAGSVRCLAGDWASEPGGKAESCYWAVNVAGQARRIQGPETAERHNPAAPAPWGSDH